MDRPDVSSDAASGLLPAGNAGSSKPSLDDAISAALAAPVEPPAQKDVAVKSSKGEKPKAPEIAPEPESAGDERDDEDAPNEEPNKPVEAKDEKAPPKAPKLSEPPKHWAAPDKEAFAALPDEAKAIVLKLSKNLEGGFTRKSQELSDKARYADTVRSLFTDADRQQMAQAGTDEAGAVRYLLGLQRFASQRPAEYVKWAMRNLGVSPDQLGFPQAQPKAGTPKAPSAATNDQLSDVDLERLLADPRVDQLEAELNAIKARDAENERSQRAAAEQRQQQAVQSIRTQLGQFREAQDDNGLLKYPHFETVMTHMGALMETDPDLAGMPDGWDKLEKAYDMAVWARPDLRQSLLADQTARVQEAERKRLETERARRATAVKPASATVTTPSRRVSLDDAVALGMNKLASR